MSLHRAGAPRKRMASLALVGTALLLAVTGFTSSDSSDIPPVRMYAFDASTGARRWAYTSREPEDAAYRASVNGDVAIVFDHRGLSGLDVVTGVRRWTRSLDADHASSPVFIGGLVFLVGRDGVVHAFDAGTGASAWSVRRSRDLRIDRGAGNEIEAGAGVVLVTARGGREVAALDARDGAVRWKAGFRREVSSITVVSDAVVTIDEDGNTFSLDAATGAVRWSHEQPRTEEHAYIPFVASHGAIDAGDTIGLALLDRRAARGGLPTTSTVFVDVQTGAERWRTPSGILSSFSFDPAVGLLFEYGEQRQLLARDPATGAIAWQAIVPPSGLLATAETLFVVPTEGRYALISALDPRNGATRWSTEFAAMPRNPVAGSTQVVLVTAG